MKTFEQFNLKITAEANLRVVNFLDVTFDLGNGKLKPYRKPNDDQLCIDRQTLEPPTSIIKQLPTSINKGISLLSSNEQTFHETAPLYQNALRYSNFDHKLGYTRKNAQVGAILMKTGLNNVLLFTVVNNTEQCCYIRFRLNNIVQYC